MLVLTVIFGCLTWFALGIFYSLPFTYGTAREFWSARNDTVAYRSLFSPLHLTVIVLAGPLVGILMAISARQLGAITARKWPSENDWDRATKTQVATTLSGQVGVTVQASAVR